MSQRVHAFTAALWHWSWAPSDSDATGWLANGYVFARSIRSNSESNRHTGTTGNLSACASVKSKDRLVYKLRGPRLCKLIESASRDFDIAKKCRGEACGIVLSDIIVVLSIRCIIKNFIDQHNCWELGVVRIVDDISWPVHTPVFEQIPQCKIIGGTQP